MTQRRWEMRGTPQIVQGGEPWLRWCALCGDTTCVLFSFDPDSDGERRICLCEVCLVEATVWIRECVEEED